MCDEPPLDASATHLAQGLVRLLVHPLLHLAHFNATALAAMAHPREQPSSSATVLHACAGRLNSLETGWPVCDEDLQSLRASDCLVYSVGVGGDFSFDDRLADQGTASILPRGCSRDIWRTATTAFTSTRGACAAGAEAPTRSSPFTAR